MSSPIKITVSSRLPKNEKDLICMLLAGRLKDLFNGRLICAQLAVDDLIKDATGVSALASLREGLVKLKTGLDDLKTATGYDRILNGVNQALGQITNVFSLGGLCPSPVQAPRVPDVLAQMNAGLFGQANNILNSLAKVMNPSLCLGGGPGGFGINWNSLTGDLRQLKALIENFKNDPGQFQARLNAFERNLKMQIARLEAEIKRLGKNLADPLGINKKQQTIRSLQRVKNSTDGYPVKDANGIVHNNVMRRMVTADVEAAIENGDTTMVSYKTVPILNYCGDVEGFKRVAITGSLDYAGWDPNDDSNNLNTPTTNPRASFLNYDFLFKEENGTINVYDKTGNITSALNIKRGVAYKIGFELETKEIKLYSDAACTNLWSSDGMIFSASPEYGSDLEVINYDGTVGLVEGEFDWPVTIESPTTPNNLYWSTVDGSIKGMINVDPTSPTTIPLEDRVYDLSTLMMKTWMQYESEIVEGIQSYKPRNNVTFNVTANLYNANQQIIASANADTAMSVTADTVTADINGNTDEANKISKTVIGLGDKKIIFTRLFKEQGGVEINEVRYFLSPTDNETDATDCMLLKFSDPISVSSAAKLPYSDPYKYQMTFLSKINGEWTPVGKPITNSDNISFELVEKNNEHYIRYNITSNKEDTKWSIGNNEFILRADIWTDKTKNRNFVDSFPAEHEIYMFIKSNNGSAVEFKMLLK